MGINLWKIIVCHRNESTITITHNWITHCKQVVRDDYNKPKLCGTNNRNTCVSLANNFPTCLKDNILPWIVFYHLSETIAFWFPCLFRLGRTCSLTGKFMFGLCLSWSITGQTPIVLHKGEKIKAYKLQVENILNIDAWKEKSQGKKLFP